MTVLGIVGLFFFLCLRSLLDRSRRGVDYAVRYFRPFVFFFEGFFFRFLGQGIVFLVRLIAEDGV